MLLHRIRRIRDLHPMPDLTHGELGQIRRAPIFPLAMGDKSFGREKVAAKLDFGVLASRHQASVLVDANYELAESRDREVRRRNDCSGVHASAPSRDTIQRSRVD